MEPIVKVRQGWTRSVRQGSRQCSPHQIKHRFEWMIVGVHRMEAIEGHVVKHTRPPMASRQRQQVRKLREYIVSLVHVVCFGEHTCRRCRHKRIARGYWQMSIKQARNTTSHSLSNSHQIIRKASDKPV